MQASRETWYERIKRRLLNNKFVAILVLISFVLAALATAISNLETISKLFRKKAVLSVVLDGPKRTQRFRQEVFLLEVALNTDKPVTIDDVQVMLSFSTARGTRLTAAESVSYFASPSLPILVPPLSTASPKRVIRIPIRAQRSGEYVLEVHVKSPKQGLTGGVSQGLLVDATNFSQFVSASPVKSPLFVVENGIADAAPEFFRDSFKILLPEIADERGLFAATLWFEPDYVGALGGAIWHIYTSYRPSTGEPDEYAYRGSLKLPVRKQSYLEEVGILQEGRVRIPLGHLFYDIEMIDSQRIRIVPREPICREVSAQVIGPAKFTSRDAENIDATEWSIPRIPLRFLTGYNCGATGRNCVLELEVRGRVYRELSSIEFMAGTNCTDFPFLVKLDARNYVRFSHPFGSDLDKVSVSVCVAPE